MYNQKNLDLFLRKAFETQETVEVRGDSNKVVEEPLPSEEPTEEDRKSLENVTDGIASFGKSEVFTQNGLSISPEGQGSLSDLPAEIVNYIPESVNDIANTLKFPFDVILSTAGDKVNSKFPETETDISKLENINTAIKNMLKSIGISEETVKIADKKY